MSDSTDEAIARIERWIREHPGRAYAARFPVDDVQFVMRQLGAARAMIARLDSQHAARLAVRGVPGFSVPQPVYEHSVSEADPRFCSKCGAFAEDGKCTIPDAMATVHDAPAAAPALETIDTIDELRALPHGTVLLDAHHFAWQVWVTTSTRRLLLAGSNWRLDLTDDNHARAAIDEGPFTVLLHPEDAPDA